MLANLNEPDKKTKKQNATDAGNLKEKWRILSDVAGKLKKKPCFTSVQQHEDPVNYPQYSRSTC